MTPRARYERAWKRAVDLDIAPELAELAERAVSTLAAAEDTYDAIRWGQEPDGVLVLDAPAIAAGETIAVLGLLEYVEYSGDKGDGVDTIWMHPFEDEKPRLCVNAEGKLIVAGGDYRVTSRGIVG